MSEIGGNSFCLDDEKYTIHELGVQCLVHPEVHGLDGRAIGEADGILVHRELGVIFSVTIDQQHCHPIPRGTTQIY